MTDLAGTIAPKSDQLNADDLIGGPRTIRVTGVRKAETPEQPISISFEGDGGKPYKPSKGMRRLLVQIWGRDGDAYKGRSMTLYRDDAVKFGGAEVGGIRISHLSDIDRPVTVPLTISKTSRKPYTVKPLGNSPASTSAPVARRQEPAYEPPPPPRESSSTPSPSSGGTLTRINELAKIKLGDGEAIDEEQMNNFLKGRNLAMLPPAGLEKVLEQLQAL